MSDEEQLKPYKPEHTDPKVIEQDKKEIRDAAKHAAQEAAAEELGPNDKPLSREEAEKQLHEAARKVKEEEKKHK